jgi:hypothetical protein
MEKTFTLAEAQILVNVLEPILRSAIQAHQTVEQIDTEFQGIIRKILLHGGIELDPIHVARRKGQREKAASELKGWLEEISASGAQLKDLDIGLLDFPCAIEGRIVLLCWKLGEPAIEHCHGVDEGFAGRKKIDPSMFPQGKQTRVN